jgi:hypothetical protein
MVKDTLIMVEEPKTMGGKSKAIFYLTGKRVMVAKKTVPVMISQVLISNL